MDTLGAPKGRSSPLRLAWVNPAPSSAPEAPRAELYLVLPAPVPARPVKLDVAIERHLTGGDGLTRDQFLVAFARRREIAR